MVNILLKLQSFMSLNEVKNNDKEKTKILRQA